MNTKLHRATVRRQIIARVFAGEPREYVVAEWPDGNLLPPTVVRLIMDTWTPDGSWVHKDGAILWVQEWRRVGRAVRVVRYPLVVVDPSNEVLYGVEALEVAKEQGVEHIWAYTCSDADGFPPKGQRHPAT